MQIYVDGDACPNAIKSIVFRAAERTQTRLIFVANQFINLPKSAYIERRIVASGFDVADNEIIKLVDNNDLVITADIPLADAVITKGAIALNPRGQLYTADNIKHILAMRDLSTSLRDCGIISSGSPTLSQKEIQQFANHLDRILTRQK